MRRVPGKRASPLNGAGGSLILTDRPQHGRRLLLTAGSVPVGIFASWYGAFAMLGKKIQVAARKYDPSEFRVGVLEDPGPIGCQALVHRH